MRVPTAIPTSSMMDRSRPKRPKPSRASWGKPTRRNRDPRSESRTRRRRKNSWRWARAVPAPTTSLNTTPGTPAPLAERSRNKRSTEIKTPSGSCSRFPTSASGSTSRAAKQFRHSDFGSVGISRCGDPGPRCPGGFRPLRPRSATDRLPSFPETPGSSKRAAAQRASCGRAPMPGLEFVHYPRPSRPPQVRAPG
jgi:hypothetical protein